MDYLSLLLSGLLGAFVTLICIHLLRPVALHIGLVDTPGGRKKHAYPVPLIGGIAVFLGFCFSLLCLNISLQSYRGLLAGGGILLLIGVMDDFHELTPRIRLIGQCLAALLLVEWGHLSVSHLGNLFFLGGIGLGWFALPFTVIFVLAFINAINMVDGNDGLAGVIIFGQALFFIYLSIQFRQLTNIYLLVLFCVSLLVFLSFNLPLLAQKRASIFLGDAGSTFLGFVIAWFAVDLVQVVSAHQLGLHHYNQLTILWVLAYPLFDLLSVIWHRVCAGKSPFSAGRDHLHHMLFDCGFSRASITGALFVFSVLLGVFGIFLANAHMSESWEFTLFLFCFVLYLVASTRLLVYCTRAQPILN